MPQRTTRAGKHSLEALAEQRGLASKRTFAELLDVHPKTIDRDVKRGLIDPWTLQYIYELIASWAKRGRTLAETEDVEEPHDRAGS